MLYHIVLFDLVKDNKAIADRVRDDLLSLKSLPYLSEFRLSTNGFMHNTSEGDIALFSSFDSKEKYAAYMKSTIHLEVKQKTAPFIREKQIIDFEIASSDTGS